MNKEDLLVCAQQCLKDKECCEAEKCRYFIDFEDEFNCSLISIYKNGSLSLREVAKREKLSFARIKQIQDKALVKFKKRMSECEDLLASSGIEDYLDLSS